MFDWDQGVESTKYGDRERQRDNQEITKSPKNNAISEYVLFMARVGIL